MKNKEKAILLAAFSFISRDVEKELSHLGLTHVQVLDRDNMPDLRRIIRLLQKLEIKVGTNIHKAQKIVNKAIDNVNKNMEQMVYVHSIVGFTILSNYKEHFKNKRIGRGINWDEVNHVFDVVEGSVSKDQMKYLNDSMDVADELYAEIIK